MVRSTLARFSSLSPVPSVIFITTTTITITFMFSKLTNSTLEVLIFCCHLLNLIICAICVIAIIRFVLCRKSHSHSHSQKLNLPIICLSISAICLYSAASVFLMVISANANISQIREDTLPFVQNMATGYELCWRGAQVLFYLLLLTRLKQAFAHSIYAISQRTYYLFIFGCILFIVWYPLAKALWESCVSTDKCLHPIKNDFWLVSLAFPAAVDVLLSYGLLFLFVIRSWKLLSHNYYDRLNDSSHSHNRNRTLQPIRIKINPNSNQRAAMKLLSKMFTLTMIGTLSSQIALLMELTWQYSDMVVIVFYTPYEYSTVNENSKSAIQISPNQ